MVAPIRLADLLAGLSLVSDLGFAQPPEEAMRRCVIATALARRLDLTDTAVADVYWTALLEHIGCTGFAHETSVAYGDEMAVNAAIAPMDPGRIGDIVDFVRAATANRPPGDRLRGLLFTLVRGSSFGHRFGAATCEVGRETARRLGLGDGAGPRRRERRHPGGLRVRRGRRRARRRGDSRRPARGAAGAEGVGRLSATAVRRRRPASPRGGRHQPRIRRRRGAGSSGPIP